MKEVAFEDRTVPLTEIDWDRSAWWWIPITRVVQPAVRMTSLAISLIALLVAYGGFQLAQWMFAPSWSLQLVNVARPTPEKSLFLSSQVIDWYRFASTHLIVIESFGLRELAFVTFMLLWLTLTFGLLGGVIARRGAVELGGRTIAPWGESLYIVFSRWRSFLWATGMHFIGIAVISLPFVILGLISRGGSIGGAIAGVLMLCCFPLVFSLGRFALSLVLCFPLSVVAIGVENKGDAFEGFSRSNAYVFQRPVVVVLCSLLLLLCGLVGEQLVYWTVSAGWWALQSMFSVGAGELSSVSNQYFMYGDWLAESLINSYWFSFFWCAASAVYLIVRRAVDHTELDEIDSLESEVEESLPEIPSSSQAADPKANEAAASAVEKRTEQSSKAEESANDSAAGAAEPKSSDD